MSKLNLIYDLLNGTDIDAVPVQSNFQNIETTVNTEMIERDGSVEMRAELILSGDPVTNLGAAPKQYVQSYGTTIVPIGGIIMYGGLTAPAGGTWALANGALVSTTTYPELFAIYAYRFGGSGGNFGLPAIMSGNGVFPVGGAGTRAVGSVGGSADLVVPTHVHDMSHAHTGSVSGTTGTVSADHTHAFSGTTGGRNAAHVHSPDSGGQFVMSGSGSGGTAGIGEGVGYSLGGMTTESADHAHGYSGSTGGISANHTHTFSAGVTVNTFSGNTGAQGVSPTGANMPPYIGLAFLVRLR
jgi:microcystin-dependent protein